MPAALTFIAIVVVLYLYLSITGYRCAVASGRMVEKAIGKKHDSNITLPKILILPLVLWLAGLVALLEGTEKYIARGAEAYIDDQGMTGLDRRKIREAVRDYRKKHSLF
jgi:hypothetical protein